MSTSLSSVHGKGKVVGPAFDEFPIGQRNLGDSVGSQFYPSPLPSKPGQPHPQGYQELKTL